MKNLIQPLNKALLTITLSVWSCTHAPASSLDGPPEALCTNVTVQAPLNSCTADASIDAGSFDPQGDTITLTQEPAGPYPIGVTVVTLRVADSGGAIDTCTAMVTVTNTTPPALTCPPDITVQESVPGSGTHTFVPPSVNPTPSCDPSEIITVTFDPPAGSPLPLGPSTITVTAVGESMNTNTCTFTVYVCPHEFVVNSVLDTPPGDCSPMVFTAGGFDPAATLNLREAVCHANQCPGTNLITFQIDQDIFLDYGPIQITDDLIIDGSNNGTPTMEADGSIDGFYGRTDVVIDADFYSRIFEIVGPSTPIIAAVTHVELIRLTLAGGYDYAGGAIINAGHLTVRQCNFFDNVASSDFLFKGAESAGSEFDSFYYSDLQRGGAILNLFNGSLFLIDSTFAYNGVLISESAPPIILDFEGGGAVFNDQGHVEAVNCTFSMNLVIGPDFDLLTGGFETDYTALGGALFNNAGFMQIFNSTIVQNAAINDFFPGDTGAQDEEDLSASFHEFEGGFGGGIFSFDSRTGFDPEPRPLGLHLKNTIIGDNYAQFGPDISGPAVSHGFNILSIINGSTGFPEFGDKTGDASNPLDPKVLRLRNNGGPTPTHALAGDSPALDMGHNVDDPANDQRGEPRIANLRIDIGAYEEQLPPCSEEIVVTSLDDNPGRRRLLAGASATNVDPGSLPFLTLRDAIEQANRCPGPNRITFAVTGTIQLLAPLPRIGPRRTAVLATDPAAPLLTDLTIEGPGANQLTIQGPGIRLVDPTGDDLISLGLGGSHGSILEIGGASVDISGLSFADGLATRGGAILNQGWARIARCNFTSNRATDLIVCICMAEDGIPTYHPPQGGAIYNDHGALSLDSSTFAGNTADGFVPFATGAGAGSIDSGLNVAGGAVFNNHGHVEAINCTFSGNTAGSDPFSAVQSADPGLLQAAGGALCNFNGGMEIRSCTIVDNQALPITTTTFTTAPSAGGGIFTFAGVTANIDGGWTRLQNTIVARNQASSGPDLFGPAQSEGNNLIGDGTDSSGFTHGTNGDKVGDTAAPIDPVLGPLAFNGGTTPTCELLTGSPAIDMGGATPATDQRGFPRGVNGTNDIGAFESQIVCFITGYYTEVLRRDFTGEVGMKITVGDKSMTITALGRLHIPANTQDARVTITRVDDQSTISQQLVGIIPSPGSPWIWAELPTRVTLQSNTMYYVTLQVAQGGDFFFDVNKTVLTTTDAASVDSGAYATASPAFFQAGTANSSYGLVNLKYFLEGVTPAAPIPAPIPQIRIVSPLEGTVFLAPASFTIHTETGPQAPAALGDDSEIVGVEFFINGVLQGNDGTAPFQFDVTNLPEGTHTLRATGFTIKDVQAHSQTVTITVSTNDPTDCVEYVTSVSLGRSRKDYTGRVGMKITVGPDPINITRLARYVFPGNTQDHTVSIINAATSLPVPGGSVTVPTDGIPTGAFNYVDLPVPVTLDANAMYYIVSSETSNLDTWADLDTSLTTTPVATVNGPVYLSTGGGYITPTVTGDTYVPVSFCYIPAGTPPPHPTVPTVAIISPVQNQEFPHPADFDVVADVSPGITKVTFYKNNAFLEEVTSAPWKARVKHPLLGTCSFFAIAMDNQGHSVTSSVVTVTIFEPPTGEEACAVVTTVLGTKVRTDFTGFVGMKISVGPTPLALTRIGRMILNGNSGSHLLRVVDAVTLLDVAALTIPAAGAPIGEYKYGELPTPVILLANRMYYVVSQETAGADQWYEIGESILTPSPFLSINSGVFFHPSWGWVSAGTANNAYGPVNIKFRLPGMTASGGGGGGEVEINGTMGATPKLTVQRPAAAGDLVTLRVEGEAGQTIIIEASDDLVHWKQISNQVAERDLTVIADPESVSRTHRFYRIR